MNNVYNNILECVGNTPIVKLNKVTAGLSQNYFAKLECFNPGSSIKDRIAVQIIKDAVASGELKPGGTIVENTSGNTGMGLAIVACIQGYKAVFVVPDKVSSEKIRAMEAMGAEVVVTPTAVEPTDPRSYYSVAKRISEERENAIYVNQYFNPSNPKAHELSTGPEIWDQMGSDLDYLFIASGTGGTISGCSKYLKEKNPKLKVICVDPIGSIYYDYFKTGKIPDDAHSYHVEGFGEDMMPSTIDFSLVDDVVQVSDAECFDFTRRLAREEALFIGGSCGGAVAGAVKFADQMPAKANVLVILPDHGSRYLSKIYNDEWLEANGFGNLIHD